MEDFIWRLAVAVIPFLALVGSATLISGLSRQYKHNKLALHRRRRAMQRALVHGATLR